MQNYIFVLVIAIVLIGVIFAIVQYFKRKGMAWEGTIIDKGYNDVVHENSNMRNRGSTLTISGMSIGMNRPPAVTRKYYVVVKTESGQELRWDISEGLYQAINIGEKLRKDAGTMIPEVIK